MSQLTRRHILRGVGAAAAVTWPLIPKFAHAAAEFTYKYGNNLAAGAPDERGREEGRRSIRGETKGRLDIQVFPSSQLGADTDMLSQVRSGALEFYSQSGLVLASIVPVAGINGIGFAFKDYDACGPRWTATSARSCAPRSRRWACCR